MTPTTALHSVTCSICSDTSEPADIAVAAVAAADDAGWLVDANGAACPACITRAANTADPALPQI